MICSNCGTENREDRLFCRECGTSLAPPCPNCGAANDPGDKFCGRCGTALVAEAAPVVTEPAPAPEPTAPAGPERRFVTALFADLVGFTTFSESRDPEEVRSMLTSYFDRSREIIERFGGTVDKFIGDAITAFWGATIAHEDDPERAVRAALELVDSVSKLGGEIGVPELALRAGVLTGETSVGPGGNEKGLVVGDVVNTASRLQSVAEPGTVLVGESTYQLVNEAIQFDPVGDQELKGKALPVPAWRALRVVAERGGSGRSEGLEPPFVGREEELRLLKDLLHATGREGRARLVSLVGQGGIGKSRLLWEFQKYVDGLVENVYWHQGRSPAYGDGLTFWALGEMVRRRAGIAETDDDHKTRTKLRTAVAEYVPDTEEQRWIEPRLAGLLGLEDIPTGDRAELYAAWRTFFHRISDQGTTALVFEDLHWADTGLLEFIEELVERSQQTPILVITLARPDLLERRPDWGSGRTNFLSLHLGPLAETEMTELVAGVVPGIPAPMVERIVARSAGVPLYAVEIVRMLVTAGDLVAENGHYRLDTDVTELAVPESLQSVIAARLDRLEPEDRALIQDAAVLGQAFTLDGLSALRGADTGTLGEQLSGLVRKELLEIDVDPRSPERGQYRFVQSLIREVAYGRLTLEERRSRHLHVARYFESLDDLELAGVVASHYLDAYRAAPEGPEAQKLADRARAALREAAERAAALHSHEQALAICEQALEITDEPDEKAALWEIAARSALALINPEQAEEFARQALEAHEELGDDAGIIHARRILGRIYNDSNQPDKAVEVLQPVVAGSDIESDPELVAAAAELARGHLLTSDDRAAAATADLALVAAEHLDLVDVVAEAMITRGTSLGNVGRPREGIALLKAALELVEDYELTASERRSRNNLGYIMGSDEPLASIPLNQASLRRARRIGDPFWELAERDALIKYDVWLGQYDEARALLQEIELSELPTLYRVSLELEDAFMEVTRGEPEAGEKRSLELMEEIADVADYQVRFFVDLRRASLAFFNGRFEEAYHIAMAINDNNPFPRDLYAALWSALMLADRDKLAAILEVSRVRPRRGRVIDALNLTLEAGIDALEGRTDQAVHRFGEAIRLWDEVCSPLDGAAARACFAQLVGLDHPDAREAAEAAYQTFTDLDVATYLDIFDTGYAPAEAAARAG